MIPSCGLVARSLSMILRAISGPLAHGGEHARRTVVVIVVALLGLDVCVDGVGDRLVRAARLMLVDHGRSLAVVTHPRHEIPQARATGRRERVAGMAQIVKMQALGTDRLH